MATLLRPHVCAVPRTPTRRVRPLALLPAAAALLLPQRVAGASGLLDSSEGGSFARYLAGFDVAFGWLETQAAAHPALSCLLVGSLAGLLAYLALRRLHPAGRAACAVCGVLVYALLRTACAHLGYALPDGFSIAAVGIVFAGCVVTILGARLVHGL